MIKTFTFDAGIEKRIRGKHIDDIQYDVTSVASTSAGVGIKVCHILQSLQLDAYAYIVAAHSVAPLIKDDMEAKQIPYTLLETNGKGKVDMVFIDEEENCDTIEENEEVQDTWVTLLAGIVKETIHLSDVIVLEYNKQDIQEETMRSFYTMIHDSSQIQICDLHPKYWGMLKEANANVLIVNEQQCLWHANKTKMPLSDMMEYIQKEVAPLTKIVIFTLQCNDLLLFVEGKIYRVVYTVKNIKRKIYKEAIICGVLKCYGEDGDLKTLGEECIAMSVGTSLSDGLQIPNEEAKTFIKEKAMLYTL